MLALLTYPVAIEPWLTTHQQQIIWSFAFGGFALLSALSVRLAWKATPTAAKPDEAPAAPPTVGRRLMWLALPACASTLLLAVTNQMCQEVAVVPFLWLIPLSALPALVHPAVRERPLVLPQLVRAGADARADRAERPPRPWAPGPAFSTASRSIPSACSSAACFCHGELAARRPAPRYLTSYYLLMSLGGALGGVFVSLVAPLLFRGFDELYVGLVACGALAAGIAIADPANIIAGKRMFNPMHLWLFAVVGLVLFVLGLRMAQRARPGLQELRDFYGTIRVAELPSDARADPLPDPRRHAPRPAVHAIRTAARIPTSYFTGRCGIGILLNELATAPPRRMAIIGLGAGILATYGREGDFIRYYELSPRMIDVARSDFTFLSDSKATIEVVPGDARLSLERETAEPPYDILVGDAFSSDAIPAHLLTREAFQLYARRLKPDGVLALNVSTRHLDLGPADQGAGGVDRQERRGDRDREGRRGRSSQRAMDPDHVRRERCSNGPGSRSVARTRARRRPPPRLWTDDYSNLFQVLKK